MPERLLEMLDTLGRARVVVVGDVILDRYVWGEVDRISPEAPIPVLAVSKEETSLGGAASVVNERTSPYEEPYELRAIAQK